MNYTIFAITETQEKTPVCNVANFGDVTTILIGLRAGLRSYRLIYTAEKTSNF